MNPKPTRAEKKALNRCAILDAAREHFLAKGYEATTLREVALSAGVSAASVIVHFADKRALLFACFYAEIAAAQERVWETMDERAPLIEQLVHCARVLFEAYAEHPAVFRVMFKETMFPGGEDPPDNQAGPFLERIAALYRRGLERGEVDRLPQDGNVAAQAFFSVYVAVLIGGLGGHFGEHADAREAAAAWAEHLGGLVRLHHEGLRAN